MPLEESLDRSCTVRRIIAFSCDQFLCRICQLQCDLAFFKTPFDILHSQSDDFNYLRLCQRREHYDIIDTIEEFRSKIFLGFVFNLLLDRILNASVRLDTIDKITAADVRCHYNYSIFEIYCSALIVCKSAIIQKLQQDVENIRMCFLYFIEQNNAVRLSSHCLSQLTAFIVSDISRRRTDQS